MKHWIRTGLSCFVVMLAVACGGKSGSTTDANNGGGDGGNPVDDGGTGIDAIGPVNCTPGLTQCSNCIDDDKDGRIDGFDPECTGAADNDEGSFATDIPGDNKDAVNQDCFFDGNSGAGQDCNTHVCCLLGAKTVAECPSGLGQKQYNPAECPPPLGEKPLTETCKASCGKLTPPGCDCFGCCKVCDPTTNNCSTILINPVTSPGCSAEDPSKCVSCTQITDCGTPQCGGETCILCPGQDPSDLPASCGGNNMCPGGSTSCIDDSGCDAQSYCSNGCCIGVIL